MNEDLPRAGLPAGVWRQIALGCIAATALTIGVFLLYHDTAVWAHFTPARAFEQPMASERIYAESIFRTRANTWSNLAYVYVGILAVCGSLHDARTKARGGYLVETSALGIFFGLSGIYLGVGSGIFHGSLTRWGQQLDVASMYSTLVALWALNLGRLLPRLGGRPSWPLWIALAVVVDVLLYVYKWSMSSSIVLPALILGVLAFGIRDRFSSHSRLHTRWMVVASVTLVLSVASKGLDFVWPLKDPEIWLKGHALWHVFTAASLGCMYAYYRTERAA